jgi:sterol desaturase/sphingolipid hydroxylase (fatty acid hydroxylase superfamily)
MDSAVTIITPLVLDQATTVGVYLAAMLLSLAVLRWLPTARARPDQRLWTQDMKIDLVFSLAVVPVLFLGLDLVDQRVFTPLARALPYLSSYHAATARLPLPIQVVLAACVKEFVGYWRHRAMHWGPLWKFHEVHHAAEYVDFATSSRFHPGELIGTWLVAILTAAVMTLPPTPAAWFFAVVAIRQLVLHANLRWTYGRLGWVFNSPAAHRWHHHPEVGKAHNFSVGVFALFDVMFGTFYLPPGECPTVAGVDRPTPRSCLGLLRLPFEASPTSRHVRSRG